MNATAIAQDGWGQDPAMNPIETVMWRAEADPALKSTMIALEVLDRAPDWADFVATHQHALVGVPRLRHRVVEPPFGLAAPRWSPDPQFDLHFHLRRSTLRSGATWKDLFSAAEQIAMSPFDRSRPPWEATLFEGLPDGRAAYVLKLHHASTDGVGTLQLMKMLHSSLPTTKRAGPRPERGGMTAWGVLGAQALDSARSAPSVVRRAGAAARRVVADPGKSLLDGVRYGLSLQRVLSPPPAAPSPLLAGRSVNWRYAALDVDLASLRAAAKAAGGSLNDAYIAALLGGYRRYHEGFGAPVDAIPMAIPISVRRDGDGGGGNRFATARLAGPVGVTDPRERIEAIGELVRTARQEPALDNIRVLAPLLARLPASVIAQIAGDMARSSDLQASNVPGAREEVHFAGTRVERLYPFAPLPGCPAMITLVSHLATCCIGVNYDAAAFTDGDLFLSSLEDGFTEVLALAGPDAGAARWLR
ncbi:wax ester/triacylglycerol synthase domain-containing protein [Nocardioides sp. Soil796]|uniref:wax ester/triacylglycerol synthase domain-containing protein n=1 Tax=Nocardioides sp. Soil796 TaxID=1736412 RepID=UPI000A99743A|nr:wax ester/triacylglycerol synthase domain-containing protein [Nocardioides sp. Soil796]